jgi:prephenate dehydrogenase
METIKSPLVVGYKGEIGSFILNGLLRTMPKALNIWCVDINETNTEVLARIDRADIIFLCVPLQITLKWLIRYKHALKNKIIIEQCSIKEWICNHKIAEELDIRSMHILFRPSQTPLLSDRKVGLINYDFDYHTINDIKLITQSEIKTYKNAKQHDEEMAMQQALLHRTILIMGPLLRQSCASTYLSKRILELENRIKSGNFDLYEMIQKNKYLPQQIKKMNNMFKNFNLKNYW